MSRGRSGKRAFPDNGWEGFGGYMKAKTMKLEHQFHQDAPRNIEKAGSSSTIFKGVSIYVNGYTNPPAVKLKQLMMTHGGRYIYYPNKTNTTHIIASNLAYTKIKELKNEKVVTPDWITDSIKAGKLLPHASYLLYRPKASNQTIHRYASTSLPDESDASETGDVDKEYRGSVSTEAEKFSSGDKIRKDITLELEPGSSSQSDSSHIERSSTSLCDERDNEEFSSKVKIPESTDILEKPSPSEEEAKKLPGTKVSPGLASTNQSAGGGFPKSNDASFLSEFYSHSRLHYISTWGAEYKAFVNELQKTGDRSFPGRKRLKELVREDRDLEQDEHGDNEGRVNSWSSNVKGRKNVDDRVIMHIDMDCFFVSVSLLKYPELRGRPVAVTHSKGKSMPETNQESREYERAHYAKKMGTTEGFSKHDEMGGEKEANTGSKETNKGLAEMVEGKQNTSGDTSKSSSENKAAFNSMAEIASCSYEARKAGVKNGMFMGRAKDLCPELQTIPYDFEGYQRVSRCLYETVASYTHDIEAVSCDEMLVDISNVLNDTGVQPLEFADILREEVYAKTECHASTGLASNILLARMSTKVAKPNGMFYMKDENVEEFMKTKSVRDLPGVGWSMNRKLQEMEVSNCGHLQLLSLATLQKEFGPKTGQQLYSYCRGKDDRPIRMERERKSVSAEVNYGIRFKGEDDSIQFITELAGEVHKRLRNLNMVGRTITVKLKVRQAGAPKETSKFMGHGVCDDKARSITLGQETDDLSIVQRESKGLFLQMRVPPEDVRGVGIQISRLKSKSDQPVTSKSIVDMFPKRADVSKAVQRTNPETVVETQTMNESKLKPKTSSLLNFVTKQSKDSPSKNKVNNKISPTKETALPRLPTLESPPASQNEVEKKVAAKAGPRSKYHLPSPSQLDLSVLDSLPSDLRSQILREYKHTDIFKRQPQVRLHRIDQASTSTGITSDLDQDVLQHLPPDILQEVLENEGKQVNKQKRKRKPTPKVVQNLGRVEELPSFSQIDPSCLEALPEDVRNELNTAYQRKLKVKPTAKKSPSPRKQLSPSKISKRKGRPRKGSPSKTANQKLPWQRNILEALHIQESPTKAGSMDIADGDEDVFQLEPKNRNSEIDGGVKERQDVRTDNTKELQGGSRDMKAQDRNENVKLDSVEKQKAVSLGGAVTLKDVKALLREWTGSFQNPLEDDIGMVVQYLRELILEKNLEMVHHVLRGLKRIVTRSQSKEWTEACRVITGRVQNTVEQIYGASLKFEL